MPSCLGDLPVRLALPAAGVVRDGLAPLADRRRRLGRADRHVRVGRVRDAQQQVCSSSASDRAQPLLAGSRSGCRARSTRPSARPRRHRPPSSPRRPRALTCLRSARSDSTSPEQAPPLGVEGKRAGRRAPRPRPCRARPCGSRRRRRAAAGCRRSSRHPPRLAQPTDHERGDRAMPAASRRAGRWVDRGTPDRARRTPRPAFISMLLRRFEDERLPRLAADRRLAARRRPRATPR